MTTTEMEIEKLEIIELSIIPNPTDLEDYLEIFFVGEKAWEVEYSEMESKDTCAARPIMRHQTISPYETDFTKKLDFSSLPIENPSNGTKKIGTKIKIKNVRIFTNSICNLILFAV